MHGQAGVRVVKQDRKISQAAHKAKRAGTSLICVAAFTTVLQVRPCLQFVQYWHRQVRYAWMRLNALAELTRQHIELQISHTSALSGQALHSGCLALCGSGYWRLSRFAGPSLLDLCLRRVK